MEEKMIAVILASHGRFAEEALHAAEMVVGKQENCAVLSVSDDKNLEKCLTELNEMCDCLDTTHGLLILVDMYGGTPCNASCNLLLTRQNGIDMELLSGFNLPVLLEVFSNREMPPSEMKEYITEVYPQMLKDLKPILNESGDDDADQLG